MQAHAEPRFFAVPAATPSPEIAAVPVVAVPAVPPKPGQAFSRRQMLEAWPGNDVSLRMIDVTIWRLRALIEQDVSAPPAVRDRGPPGLSL